MGIIGGVRKKKLRISSTKKGFFLILYFAKISSSLAIYFFFLLLKTWNNFLSVPWLNFMGGRRAKANVFMANHLHWQQRHHLQRHHELWAALCIIIHVVFCLLHDDIFRDMGNQARLPAIIQTNMNWLIDFYLLFKLEK